MMSKKVRNKPFVRGDRVTFRLSLEASDKLLEWINSIKLGTIGPEIANILEQYANRELININAFKEVHLVKEKTTKDTISLKNENNKGIDSEAIDDIVGYDEEETDTAEPVEIEDSIKPTIYEERVTKEQTVNDIGQAENDTVRVKQTTDYGEKKTEQTPEYVDKEKPITKTKKKRSMPLSAAPSFADKNKAKSIFDK